MASDSTATIYQFKIELIDTTPIVWRQVQVPSTFDMFDLHAALNDAMVKSFHSGAIGNFRRPPYIDC